MIETHGTGRKMEFQFQRAACSNSGRNGKPVANGVSRKYLGPGVLRCKFCWQLAPKYDGSIALGRVSSKRARCVLLQDQDDGHDGDNKAKVIPEAFVVGVKSVLAEGSMKMNLSARFPCRQVAKPSSTR